MVGPGDAAREDRSPGPARLSAGEVLKRLPLAPTLTITLIALTLLLALIAAIGIGKIYSARQDYENAIARTYELQASAARLLAAGVIEETAFRNRGPNAPEARANAREAFDNEARIASTLAADDDESARLLKARLAAERQARGVAAAGRAAGRTPTAEQRLADAIYVARTANDDLAKRQRLRRASARADASDRTRSAVITVAVAGGLALLGALVLIVALIGSIRRPLDELVDATKELAGGDLSKRVEPSGPQELRELDSAFNTMAEQLQGARGRIEAERERLVTTIESLGDALVVCERDGRVSAVNPRAQDIVPELRPGEPAEGPGSPLPPLGDALTREVIAERGGRTLAITASQLGGPDGGVVWTLRDISERARLERIKSDFVATASHELRSPLTSIKGFVELLERSTSLADRDREFVDVILKSTDRLVELVNDLLDVTKLDAGKMEFHPRLFDLAEQIREVAVLMGPRIAAKEQRLEIDLPPTLPRGLADPVRVRQILNNLISNAHLYTAEGGTITVGADHVDGELILEIADTGRGMTAEDLDRVFERFVRRDDGAGGTGLGLAIVKSLVDLQGGTIAVESHPGEGTTFTVRLPAEEFAGEAEPHAAIRGKRVLVVDDDYDIAKLLAADLEPYDIVAEIETDGELALERLRREQLRRGDPGRPDGGQERLRGAARDPRRREPAAHPGGRRLRVVGARGPLRRVEGGQADRPAPPRGRARLGGARRAHSRPRGRAFGDARGPRADARRARPRPRVGDERRRGGAGVQAPPLRGRTGRRGHPQPAGRSARPRPPRPAARPGGAALLVGRGAGGPRGARAARRADRGGGDRGPRGARAGPGRPCSHRDPRGVAFPRGR